MRIAYDHHIFWWQTFGGISRYYFEVANRLAHAGGHEVCIVSPLYVNTYLAGAGPSLRVKGRRVPHLRGVGRFYRAVNQALVPPILARYAPDIAHETYYAPTPTAPASSKVVLTVFDMIHERFPECFGNAAALSAHKRAAVDRADRVIFISAHTRNDLIELFGIAEEKTAVVHLGHSLTQPPRRGPRVTDRPYLLYVGGRFAYKNFQLLLKAYATEPTLRRDYDIVVFGGGPISEAERRQFATLNVDADRIHHREGDDGLLADLYSQAALFVYPSRYEGFGIPPLEAMGFDCPVVCSTASSIPEVVGDAAEYFDPDSVGELIQALDRVLTDSSRRQFLVDQGRVRAARFTWDTCARQTLSVYRSLV